MLMLQHFIFILWCLTQNFSSEAWKLRSTQIQTVCGDPDFGCVAGISLETCTNGTCDYSVESRLTQCYLNTCSDPGPIPLCSCPNKAPVTTVDPISVSTSIITTNSESDITTVAATTTTQSISECNEPDLGCVDGVSLQTCENGTCDSSVEGRLTQCFLKDCLNPGPIPQCSCPNLTPVTSTDTISAATPSHTSVFTQASITTDIASSTTESLQECGDPELGCVDGISIETCKNGLCNASTEGKLTQCYSRPCLDPGSIPKCSCPNLTPGTTTDQTQTPTATTSIGTTVGILPCGDPDMGCVDGTCVKMVRATYPWKKSWFSAIYTHVWIQDQYLYVLVLTHVCKIFAVPVCNYKF